MPKKGFHFLGSKSSDAKKKELNQKLLRDNGPDHQGSEMRRFNFRRESSTTTSNPAPMSIPLSELPKIDDSKEYEPYGENIPTKQVKDGGSKELEKQWDLCIIVPNPSFIEPGESQPRKVHMHYEEIVERLLIGGLYTYQFYSGDEDEIFIKGAL